MHVNMSRDKRLVCPTRADAVLGALYVDVMSLGPLDNGQAFQSAEEHDQAARKVWGR